MEVFKTNDVKIYNLSSGKSLPDWLSERKRRALVKKDVDIRRRIELIQDFDMPGVSTTVKISNDGQYVFATGVYKPRVKCFEVSNLSLKFERCFDSEAVTFEILSNDYSKLVFLQCDRYIEFHDAHGRLHRLRIPKFGRDMRYHYPSCDLFIVGSSHEIYRINLDRGQFMTPFESGAVAINKCEINPVHQLLVCGTHEGRVEAWDPRTKGLVGTLDCAFSCITENQHLQGMPAITALKFNGALNLAVGTATGQVLLYDIRSNKPYYVKDDYDGVRIRDVEFHHQQDLVFSMTSNLLKIWNQNSGKLYTSISAPVFADFNNLCVAPNSGLFFIANESPKIQTYYVPSMGLAPKWAGFLDSLTEELEESNFDNVYDDYKFVTKKDLETLGMEHLIGTNLLRAYMHGYFMDIKLYKKARSLANPFEFEEYRKKKVREAIERDRPSRLPEFKQPKVNKVFAAKLMEEQKSGGNKKKKGQPQVSLLDNPRFKQMFENPDFEIDPKSEWYQMVNPLVSRMDQAKKKPSAKPEEKQQEEEVEGKNSSAESSSEQSDLDSSDEESRAWVDDVKKAHRKFNQEKKAEERQEMRLKMVELQKDEFPRLNNKFSRKIAKKPLGERLKSEDSSVKLMGSVGNRQMTFKVQKRTKGFKRRR